jgi:hypothetical protein
MWKEIKSMNESRIRVIREYVRSLQLKPEQANQMYKIVKRAKARANLLANIPKGILKFSKKMHAGESLDDFQKRRKACNKRKRESKNDT